LGGVGGLMNRVEIDSVAVTAFEGKKLERGNTNKLLII